MIEPRLLARLEHKKAQLDALRPLPTAAVRRLNEQMSLSPLSTSGRFTSLCSPT